MAARVVDYQIVSALTHDLRRIGRGGNNRADEEVQEKVKELLAAGWQPLGPAQTSFSASRGPTYVVSQTMVKYDT
jgi:hypothetical protein